MASTSSSASSVSNDLCRYDVFLSFRGETRNAFTDHLYKALVDVGLTPFRDNDDIERGEDLKPEIERGIRESRASIIVLSEEYATSRWCLDELCLILKQTEKRNHYVLPIFYHVDPSHVRKQTGSFDIKVEVEPNTKWTEDNVGRWKTALTKVGNMKGEVPTGILQDIGSKSTEKLHELQEKLLGDILQGKKRKIPSVWQGTCKIENALKTEKALIVLDNIVEPSQLFVLLGTGIETQCKIIITSRESNPHKWFESTTWRCQALEMKSLDKNDSLELLSRHAFGSKALTEGYDHLVEKALQYCDGNPLALEVLGSSLSYKSNKQFWERRLNSEFWKSTLNAFDKELHGDIHKGSNNIQGLALDINLLNQGKEQHAYKSSDLNTESFKKMDNLKLLQLNCVNLTGRYKHFSEQLRWLCWIGFRLRAIPIDLFMENLVAIDMSYSCLEEFEPPVDLHSLKILNLRSSKDLREIRNIFRLRNLDILILWDCTSLTHVTLGDLSHLAILNLSGCKKLCTREKINSLVSQEGSSIHAIESTQQGSFLLPQSLERLYLMNCNITGSDYFPLMFKDQSLLIYLNLVNSQFELLPSYGHLKDLRVLDVSGCSDLKELRCLPSTLAELYIYYCNSLNIVTFDSHQFKLQEFGYEGCVNLCEVEGLFKLMPVTQLEESEFKQLAWLREYQDLTVCLVGDAELTKGRSSCVQMLYEFNIMSTSLPNTKKSNMMTDTDYMYTSQSTLLSFKVPALPEHERLEGLIITFQYTTQGEDWVWFVKVSTSNGVNLMYNPRVFGKPDEVGIWSSYWPIGKALQIEETVTVSILVIKGLLDIYWCGASLVYTDETANELLQENKECVTILGEDFSEFQLSTGAYYLCRRDFLELMEAEKLTPDWFGILVDDKIDCTEVGGWRMTGKPEHLYQSYTEMKTIRCIMYGPEMVEIYKIAELSKSSLVDKTMESTSGLSKALPMDMVINETMASTSSSLVDKFESSEFDFIRLSLQETMNQNIDSEPNLPASNMFSSEVELSNFLGSIDILPHAFDAILKTTSTHEVHRTPSGIPILAFNISPDYTKRFLDGEFDLVSSENCSLVDFISTKVNPYFFINKAAIDLYEHYILGLSKLEDEFKHKPLIITGQSLGGYLAILFTLRLQHAVDIEEANGARKIKRPICITFGSPLLGDEALQRAIGERPTWKSSFLNVVTKTDPLACIFTSKTTYMPFGTFLCCTESGGHAVFEDQEAILAVIDTMAALNAEKNKMPDYGNDLGSIRRNVLYHGAVESGKPHSNSLRAGIILQFKEVAVLGDISNDLILGMEAKQIHRIRSHKNTLERMNQLNLMKISLTCIEWYMKTTKSKGGYYDRFKNPNTKQEILSQQEIFKHKRGLDQYWKLFVEEKDIMPLQEGAKLRRRWLYGATNYRMIVEPLEIADHYKKGNTNYIATRRTHYKLLEKWYNGDTSSYPNKERKTRASSFTVDSCFWAHVEEACISLKELTDGGWSNNANDIEKRLEQFQTYLMNGINNFEVSPDIFLDGSSLMEWWKEYKEHKGNSYVSEFANYMNSGNYRMYQ